MNNKFFPYYDETGKQTLTLAANVIPADAKSLDPRDIITTWTLESKSQLIQSNLYEGMKIYSLDDRKIRICRWTPKAVSSCLFDANDCIWDTLHGEEDEWIDISTYMPELAISKQIEKAEQTKWQYNISYVNSYIGFKISNSDNEYLNFIINNTENDNHIAFTYTLSETKATKTAPITIDVDFSKYDKSCAEEIANMSLIIICPSNTRSAAIQKRYISSIKFDTDELRKDPETKPLYCKSTGSELLFDIYTVGTFTLELIENLIDGTSTLSITFTKQ